ncbi:hypothetical protein [Streptomyces collinus]|uniref:hypothetical protein n=1 Tax=Streptomyces collinus TaxID=42684 RepID=UPI003322EA24
MVLSNAVRYADSEQHRSADVLDSARLLRPIRPYAEWWGASGNDWWAYGKAMSGSATGRRGWARIDCMANGYRHAAW